MELEGEEGLHALGLEHREHFELTSLEGPQLLLHLVVVGVDGASIEQGRDLVETVGQGRRVLKATCVKIRVFQSSRKHQSVHSFSNYPQSCSLLTIFA